MRHYLASLVLAFLLVHCQFTLTYAQQGSSVLVVQDEMPQLEVLVDFLRNTGNLEVDVVDQDNLPESMDDYRAVIGFIHGRIDIPTEEAIIEYTENGGRYICLHHSISSGKARNPHYFDFLGIHLDNPEFSSNPVKPGGGYGWYHDGENGITLRLVNLNQNHYITNHNIEWGAPISYTSSDGPAVEGMYPSIALPKTEVYMNHKFTDGREKIVLAGFKFYDQRNNEIFMQDRAVWYKPYGEGLIFYFMPGETPEDYRNKNIAQMILNAVEWEDR